METWDSLKRLNSKRLGKWAEEEGVRRKGSNKEEVGSGGKIKVYKLKSEFVRYSLPPPSTRLADHIPNEEKKL